jgi:CDGSH-type Zn-finger protein
MSATGSERSPANHESRWDDRGEGGRPQGRASDRSELFPVRPRDEITVVRVTPDGPLLVRGPVRLVDEAGREVATRRRVNALCRCGRSATQPFCDGTHKIVPFSPRLVNGDSASGPSSGSQPDG